MTTARKSTGRGLGRGLAALIPAADAPVERSVPASGARTAPPTSAVGDHALSKPSGLDFAELPIDAITPNPRQPRAVFDEDALAELVHSVKEIGLLQPVVVRPVDDGYELIAGERRLRACKEAGFTTIPAIIRSTDDEAMLRDALLENLHRADLNALEEAAAYQQLLSDFGSTQEELAQRIGRSRAQVSNTLRLLRLPPAVQRKVAANVISAGHARALLSLSDEAAMEVLAERIVAEGLSVRNVEELVIVGATDGKERKPRKRRDRDQEVDEVVRGLVGEVAEQLETRVQTSGFATAKSNGKLVIECADIEDLRRIRDLIAN